MWHEKSNGIFESEGATPWCEVTQSVDRSTSVQYSPESEATSQRFEV
jgi:hypothetical protein